MAQERQPRGAKRRRTRRYFTVAEANSHLGDVKRVLGVLLQLRTEAKRLHRVLENAGYPAFADGDECISLTVPENSSSPPPNTILSDAGKLRALYAAIGDQETEIQRLGCVVRDIESGLVAWPARHNDREIWLCYEYGEIEVGHWQERHGSAVAKRPLAELVETTIDNLE